MDLGFTMGMVRQQFIACALFIGILVGPVLPQEAPSWEVRAYRIKAAFLYHFAQFSSWPEDVFYRAPGAVAAVHPRRGSFW